MVEQRTHKPLVGCSNQLLGTNFKSLQIRALRVFLCSISKISKKIGELPAIPLFMRVPEHFGENPKIALLGYFV